MANSSDLIDALRDLKTKARDFDDYAQGLASLAGIPSNMDPKWEEIQKVQALRRRIRELEQRVRQLEAPQ